MEFDGEYGQISSRSFKAKARLLFLLTGTTAAVLNCLFTNKTLWFEAVAPEIECYDIFAGSYVCVY